jgi:hypothetical protein
MTESSSNGRGAVVKRSPGGVATADPRDAAVARLERALAAERQNAGALRDSLEQLTFKLGVLEKGYTKQLADARERQAAAERALEDLKARIAAQGTGGEDTVRLLAETRAALDRVTAERDHLRREHARGRETFAAARARSFSGATLPEDQGTINELISSESWARKARSASDTAASAGGAPANEAPVGEMIAPELVFTSAGDES